MPRCTATKEHIEFAVKNCKTMSEKDIDTKFGTSKGVTMRILKSRDLRMSPEESSSLRAEKCRRIFTAKEIRYIKNNVEKKSLLEITKHLKCGKAALTKKCHELGFKDLLKEKEANSRFKKGHVPFYKGKNIPEAMKEKIKHTYFQKGHLPHNTKNDGDISVRKNTNGMIHLYYRVKMSNWIPLKNKIWIDNFGEIPKGYNVVLKNGKYMDVRPENLECISNVDLMLKNSIHSYPPELRIQIHKIAKLKRIINKKIERNEQSNI